MGPNTAPASGLEAGTFFKRESEMAGRPKFPVKHRTMNVYLPNDLHDRLAKQAHKLRKSRSALIRAYVSSCLQDAERTDAIKAKQDKVYGV